MRQRQGRDCGGRDRRFDRIAAFDQDVPRRVGGTSMRSHDARDIEIE
jgi:hypothetical protein